MRLEIDATRQDAWSRQPETHEQLVFFASKRSVMMKNWFAASLKSSDPLVAGAAAQFEAYDLTVATMGGVSLAKAIREAK